MLVLTRNVNEAVVMELNGVCIRVVLARVANGQAKLGIEAPPEVSVWREEIQRRIDQERADGVD